MKRKRKGVTLLELLVVALFFFVVIGGLLLYIRVAELNTWAVKTDAWLVNELYPWVRDNTFNGGGNPDGDKPPPPPDGID